MASKCSCFVVVSVYLFTDLFQEVLMVEGYNEIQYTFNLQETTPGF
jgi:hypothetical protein